MNLTRQRGKFSFLVDEILFNASLEGADSECGNIDTWRHFSLLKGPMKLEGQFADVTPETLAKLSDDDREFLAKAAGFIVSECGDGFVCVERFTSAESLSGAWENYLEATEEAES